MEKVKEIKRNPEVREEVERYGKYARKSCEVVIQDEKGERTQNVFLDQEEILEYISRFMTFLDEEKIRVIKENRAYKADERRAKNMKYIWLYTLAFVGAVLAWVATSPVGIPVFIGFFAAGVIVALTVNDVFKRPEELPGVINLSERMGDAMELEKEAKEAIKTYIEYNRKRINIDRALLSQGVPSLQDINNPKRCEAIRRKASFWQMARRNLNEQFERSCQIIRDRVADIDLAIEQYDDEDILVHR